MGGTNGYERSQHKLIVAKHLPFRSRHFIIVTVYIGNQGIGNYVYAPLGVLSGCSKR